MNCYSESPRRACGQRAATLYGTDRRPGRAGNRRHAAACADRTGQIKDSGPPCGEQEGEKGQTRIENLEELVTATRQFSYNDEDEDLAAVYLPLTRRAGKGEGRRIPQDAVADDAALRPKARSFRRCLSSDEEGIPQPDVAG